MITMKLGISMGGFPMGTEAARMGPLLSRLARRADAADFDSLWTMDHFFQIPITGQPPEAPLLEAYAVLAFLAAETQRIRIGTMVTYVAYRHPGVLIKAVTSIDVLSGGRVIFGVGAGAPFNELPPGRSPRDFEAYGLGIHCHHWPNGSSGWRNLCRLPCRCGAETRRPTRGRIIRPTQPTHLGGRRPEQRSLFNSACIHTGTLIEGHQPEGDHQ
jgi:hypothetical protein